MIIVYILLGLLGLVFLLFFFAVIYSAGLTRGMQIITSKQKLSKFEKQVADKAFHNLKINPLYYAEIIEKIKNKDDARKS